MIHIQQLANLIRLSDPFQNKTKSDIKKLQNSQLTFKDSSLSKLETKTKKKYKSIQNTKSVEIQKSTQIDFKQNQPKPTNDLLQNNPNFGPAFIANEHLDTSNVANQGGFKFSENHDRSFSQKFQYNISKEKQNPIVSLQLFDTLLVFRSKTADFSVMSLEILQNQPETGMAELLSKLKRLGVNEVYRNGKMMSGNRFA
ncbi:MAG: hypothetical protein H3C43_08740 [Leptonema sp. (in: Bacteria)]|nr:hypothetical protein [Leptonema sp. (in: bacteria)]